MAEAFDASLYDSCKISTYSYIKKTFCTKIIVDPSTRDKIILPLFLSQNRTNHHVEWVIDVLQLPILAKGMVNTFILSLWLNMDAHIMSIWMQHGSVIRDTKTYSLCSAMENPGGVQTTFTKEKNPFANYCYLVPTLDSSKISELTPPITSHQRETRVVVCCV